MIPCSRPKLADLYTLSQSKLPENHTLHSTAAQTYIAYICQSPLPGVLPKRSLWLSPQNSLLMTWTINVYKTINLVVMGLHSASLFKIIFGPNRRHLSNENVSSGEERDEMTVLYCWYQLLPSCTLVSKQAGDCRSSTSYLIICRWLLQTLLGPSIVTGSRLLQRELPAYFKRFWNPWV